MEGACPKQWPPSSWGLCCLLRCAASPCGRPGALASRPPTPLQAGTGVFGPACPSARCAWPRSTATAKG
eukprot:2820832-Lingulodinium_polyedra.AAC.1